MSIKNKIITKRFILKSLTTADISPVYLSWLTKENTNNFIYYTKKDNT